VEDRRTQQLASAKKKVSYPSLCVGREADWQLSNFRARGSDQLPSTFNFPVVPLTTELSGNCPPVSIKEKSEVVGGGLDKAFSMNMNFEMDTHKRQGSTGGHRRRPSSISQIPTAPLRTSVTGLYEPTAFGAGAVEPEGQDLPYFTPTPPNPPPVVSSVPLIRDEDPVTPINTSDDGVRAKFTSFSFGSKPPSTPLATLRDQTRTSSPSHSPKPSYSAPGSFNTGRLSTPLSRPPSLLVTRPTPLPFDGPLGSAPLSQTPPSPPTPARKRHSHTRSNSISMPNLKLGRPQSYSVLSSSPSFPSSPVSPDNLALEANQKVPGRKLKFEPSGRGAEAEQQRDESRRKALEKLTGQKSPTVPPPLEAAVAEISLPAEDEDEESETTPYLIQGDQRELHPSLASFGRIGHNDSPESSDISPIITPSTWQSPVPASSPAEQWSHGKSGDDHLGLGFGMDNTALKRASMPSALGVLTEEDESEDGSRGEISFDQNEGLGQVEVHETPIAPTPSRLRELHLLSSSVVSPRAEETPHNFNNRSLSESTPTKPLNSAGRRPRPLSGLGIGHAAFVASPTANSSTPLNRRRGESRGSSISYKKDNDSVGSSTGSSREWSFNRLTSPTSLGGFGSPPPATTTQFAWPRADVGEVEELASPIVSSSSSRWAQCPPSSSTPTATIDRGSSDRYSSSMTESSDYSWRDSRMELEMEREALREDAELWKMRCLNAEEHLKAERSETAILRERVRKCESSSNTIACSS
jgi:hypothetical protein